MCHWLEERARFWFKLFTIDRQIADRVQAAGCPHCGAKLHVSDYPRKPRGEDRQVLGVEYEQRLSFCCAQEGCRRRTTPPSVRFLGRKVYLGAMIIVLCAGEDALTRTQRDALVEKLNLPSQTRYRWRRWWRDQVPVTACWKALSGWFSPPIHPEHLPGAFLARLQGADLPDRLRRLLQLLSPLTTRDGARWLRLFIDPQKMGIALR